MNTISEIIASLRKSKGMTQEALANILGVSPQTVSKWETGSTMPDILLLPMIAEVFGITVDALFGIKSLETQKQYTKETFYEEMYLDICRGFTDFWRDTEDALSPEERTAIHKQYLLDHPEVNSAILANYTGNGVYANSELAVIFRREESTIQDLLEDENAWTVLKRFADGETRAVFRFIVKNPCKSFTASLLAAKCNIDVKLAERALNNLLCMNLLSRSDVDTGDGIIYAYHAWGTHKLILIYSMLSLASRLGTYMETYRGFRN